MLAGQASICVVFVNHHDEPDIMEVSINDEHPPTPVSAAVVKVADGAATADLDTQADIQSSIARLGKLTVKSPSVLDTSVATESISHNMGLEVGTEASHDHASFSSSGSASPSDDDSISESGGEECMPNDGHDLIDESDDEDQDGLESHDVKTTPLVDHDARREAPLAQYGVLGSIRSIEYNANLAVMMFRGRGKTGSRQPKDGRLYCNTNAPFSAVICGVQGSGKSHTLSVLLESMLIPDPRLGELPAPLSAIVLHFGETGSTKKPCEAAFVGTVLDEQVKAPPVYVLCSPSNYLQTKQLYEDQVKCRNVYPLYFTEEDIDAQSLLSLMAIDEHGHMPLYMQVVMTILSDLGSNYSYSNFKAKLGLHNFDAHQKGSLQLRLTLLETFLCQRVGNEYRDIRTKRPVSQPENRFEAGRLTIVDLTDPFISPGTACSLFEIVLKLFNRSLTNASKVVVLDEAHKYLSETGKAQTEGSKRLTERLLSFTRQQRHLAMRVVVSTQEPTVVPSSLLDLCSMIICHRFHSSRWWNHLAKHVSSELGDTIYDKLVSLKAGQCLIFSPTAVVAQDSAVDECSAAADISGAGKIKARIKAAHLGRGYMVAKMRQRVTADCGKSLLATDALVQQK